MRTPGILHYGTLRSGIHLFQLKELEHSAAWTHTLRFQFPWFFPHQCVVPAAGSFHFSSQNHWGWKSLRLSPTISPTPPHSPNVLKCHIQAFLEHLQGWGPHHPAKHPLPMPEHHCHGEALPVSNLNLPCCCLRQTSQGVQPSQHFLPPQL